MAYARPDSDVSVGSFGPYPASPTTLWDKVNEETQNGDTDYITTSTASDECELGLTDVDDPNIGVGHTIRCYAKSPGGGGQGEKITISLVEGSTVRASSSSTTVNRTAYGLIEYTLTEAEANAITDYTNLRIRIHIDALGGGEEIRVTQIEFQLPGEGSQRYYLGNTAQGDYTPSFDGSWDQVGGGTRRYMYTSKQSTAFVYGQEYETSATPVYCLLLQFLSNNTLSAGNYTTAQTWKLQIRCAENDAKLNGFLQIIAKVVSGDAATIRGTIINFLTDDTEFMQSLSNWQNRSMSGNISNNVSVQAGDRILLEVGFYANNTKTTSYRGQLRYGDNSGTDLPEDDSTELEYNPWFELPDLGAGAAVYTPKVIIF